VTFVKKHRVGLTVLDSIHAFHKLRDGKLEYLRDGFAALISAGTPVVLLSHITKSSTAADKGAAKGSGLIEATDYTFGMTAVAYGKFKVEPVKTRQGTEEPVSKFFVTYSGKSRLEQAPEITLEDKILQFIADAGETGTSSSAIRTRLGGSKDLIDAALIELKDQFYCDGKRGAGKHIWDLKYKPESATDSSDDDTSDDDNEGVLVAA
jgi:predicted transcriptional regulator